MTMMTTFDIDNVNNTGAEIDCIWKLFPTIVITPSNPCARGGAGAVFPLNPSLNV